MNKHLAIRSLYPNIITLRGDIAYDQHENTVSYDAAAVQNYMDAHAYIAKRATAYPPIGDQLDALWKGGAAAAEMLVQIQNVKARYPK